MLVGWMNKWARTFASINTLHVQNSSQYFHILLLMYFAQQPYAFKHKLCLCAERKPCSMQSSVLHKVTHPTDGKVGYQTQFFSSLGQCHVPKDHPVSRWTSQKRRQWNKVKRASIKSSFSTKKKKNSTEGWPCRSNGLFPPSPILPTDPS